MGTKKGDTEEDVALVDVDNAAAASMFSPNMWVRRPSRIDLREFRVPVSTGSKENPIE